MLPPLPSHSVDVRVNLKPLIPPRKKNKIDANEENVVKGIKVEDEMEQKVPKEEESDNKNASDLSAVEKDETLVPTDALVANGDVKCEEERPNKEIAKENEESDEDETLDDVSSSIFGCLSHPREPESSRLLQSLLRLKTKDVLNLLLKSLKERSVAIRQKRGMVEDEAKEEGNRAFDLLASCHFFRGSPILSLFIISPLKTGSNKIPAIADNLFRVLTSCGSDGLFLDVLKSNLVSGFGCRLDPTGQL